MIFKYFYMYFFGIIDINVEGFYIEKFINICKENNIILWKMETKNGVILKVRINRGDFEKVKEIANEVDCQISKEKEMGLPLFLDKYKKRKVFAIAGLVIAIFFFIITRFIWNIDITGLDKISKEEILSNLGNYGISIGKTKMNLNLDEIKSKIRLERNDIAWIGIEIKGTNVIVEIVESIDKPEIIDKKSKTNIYAEKDATISKIVVRNGTARVKVGDKVSARRYTC